MIVAVVAVAAGAVAVAAAAAVAFLLLLLLLLQQLPLVVGAPIPQPECDTGIVHVLKMLAGSLIPAKSRDPSILDRVNVSKTGVHNISSYAAAWLGNFSACKVQWRRQA